MGVLVECSVILESSSAVLELLHCLVEYLPAQQIAHLLVHHLQYCEIIF